MMALFLCPRNWLARPLCSLMLAGGVALVPLGAAPVPGPAASPAATTPAKPSVEPSPAASATPVPAIALGEIAPKAQEALATLKSLEPENVPDQVTDAVQNSLVARDASINELRDKSGKAAENVGGSLDVLRNLQSEWNRLEAALTDDSRDLGARGKTLDTERGQVEAITATWRATQTSLVPAADPAKAPGASPRPATPATHSTAAAGPTPTATPSPTATPAPDASVPPETLDSVKEVLYAALVTQTRIKYRQARVLDLQNRVAAFLTRVDTGQEVVEQALSSALKTLLVRESPPLWAAEAQPRPDLPGRWHAAVGEMTREAREFTDAHSTLFAVHFVVFLGLLGVFLWLRRVIHRWTTDEPHLKRAIPVFDVPIATALVLSFFVMGNRYAGAPGLLRAGVSLVALVPTIILLRRLLVRRLLPVLYSLAVFTVLDQGRAVVTSLPTVSRWLFCLEMAAAAGLFVWLIRMQRGRDPAQRVALGRWMPFLCGVAVAVFGAAAAADVIGYVRLGTLLGTAALQSSYTAVFLYALLRVLDGLTVVALRVRPVSASRIAQTHRDQVQAQVYNVFRLAAVALWIKFTLEQLQQYQSLYDRVADLLGHEAHLGSLRLSLGQLLGFAAAIWFSLLISRVLRFFLNEEVYERVQLAPGLPYAISTMLNYAVLVVGFIVALGLLGIPLSSFAIVVSAFSVGLGFGLQNIINNFVSGIILLFERPVKVGDVIQLGDATGEVRRIGIRASIIRTRDGSDIIVPNGNLISNQVTNWTYTDRERAVEITFTVAAGPDPNHVIQLLRTAATKEPNTEDRPAPQVYITGITANGLSMVVRAWTQRYEDWVQVRSELNVQLLAALSHENIKLV